MEIFSKSITVDLPQGNLTGFKLGRVISCKKPEMAPLVNLAHMLSVFSVLKCDPQLTYGAELYLK